jgi:hypothetical protein
VTLLLTKSQVRPKSGVQYFGIKVDDLASFKKRLQDGRVEIRESSQEFRLTDPRGEPSSNFAERLGELTVPLNHVWGSFPRSLLC